MLAIAGNMLDRSPLYLRVLVLFVATLFTWQPLAAPKANWKTKERNTTVPVLTNYLFNCGSGSIPSGASPTYGDIGAFMSPAYNNIGHDISSDDPRS